MTIEKKKEIKKNQLVKAALTLFLQKGFHHVRIEDIASKAQVGKGTFYLYFKSKEQMVEALSEDFIATIMSTLNWTKEHLSTDSEIKEVFKEEAYRLVQSMQSHKQLAKFIFKEGRSVSRKMDQKINSFYEELVDLSESTYALAMAAGLIPTQHPRVAAVCVVGGIIQMYQMYLSKQFEEDIDELVDSSLVFFNRALGLA